MCNRPSGKIDLVLGICKPISKPCESERSFLGGCGKSGKYWVEKPIFEPGGLTNVENIQEKIDMVQIVDPTPDPSVVKYTVCRNCGVKLSYVPADVEQDYTADYTGGREYYEYIVCPNCSQHVHVN